MINNNNEYVNTKEKGLVEFHNKNGVSYTDKETSNIKNSIRNMVNEVFIVCGAAGTGKTTWVSNNIVGDVIYAALTRKLCLYF